MAKLIWDQMGERLYETGLDRGVLYLPDGSAVPWNGLVSIQESFEDDGTEPLYYDGVKYLDRQTIGDYLANMQAITYPDEFLEFEGQLDIGPGLFADNQPKNYFALSYRTYAGNAVEGHGSGYKIHLLYNLLAVPANKDYATIASQTTPTLFNWEIAGVPAPVDGNRPTAHVVIDSRVMEPYQLKDLESILYGDNDKDADLPPLDELAAYMIDWNLITIIDFGDGTWSAVGPDDLIIMTDPTTFQITGVDATYLDADTYTVQTTREYTS